MESISIVALCSDGIADVCIDISASDELILNVLVSVIVDCDIPLSLLFAALTDEPLPWFED